MLLLLAITQKKPSQSMCAYRSHDGFHLLASEISLLKKHLPFFTRGKCLCAWKKKRQSEIRCWYRNLSVTGKYNVKTTVRTWKFTFRYPYRPLPQKMLWIHWQLLPVTRTGASTHHSSCREKLCFTLSLAVRTS